MLRAALAFFTRLPTGSAPLPPTFRGVAAWLPVVGLIVGLIVALAVALTATGPARAALRRCRVPRLGRCNRRSPSRRGGGLRRRASRGNISGSTTGDHERFPAGYLRRNRAVFCACVQGSLPRVAGLRLHSKSGRIPLPLRAPAAWPGHWRGRWFFWPCASPRPVLKDSAKCCATGVTRRHELTALAIGLAVCLLNGWRGAIALIAALFTARILLSSAQKRLGGVTGDVFGCLIELTECVVLTVCCLL